MAFHSTRNDVTSDPSTYLNGCRTSSVSPAYVNVVFVGLCARQVFLRTTESYSTGQLELRCVARRPHGECQVRDDDIIVLVLDEEAVPAGRAAETALIAHEVRWQLTLSSLPLTMSR